MVPTGPWQFVKQDNLCITVKIRSSQSARYFRGLLYTLSYLSPPLPPPTGSKPPRALGGPPSPLGNRLCSTLSLEPLKSC